MKRIVFTILPLLITACASNAPKEPVTYVEAAKIPEPQPIPAVVEVVKPMPMPGQLKPIPQKNERQRVSHEKPWDVVDSANKAAKQTPDPDGYFNSIMTYDYEDGALYQVYSAPLTLTDIQLQPGEQLVGSPAAGDTVRWILGSNDSLEGKDKRTHLLVKPTRPGLHTTLVINTNRRTYHMELHSFKNTYMAAVNWRYPRDELAMVQQRISDKSAREALITETHVDLSNLNFSYKVEVEHGSPIWEPTRVFDDGRKVFIQFPRELLTHEAPALFVLSDEGNTQLVNYRVKNNFYIVDRLFARAELRVGEKNPAVVRIVADGYKPNADSRNAYLDL